MGADGRGHVFSNQDIARILREVAAALAVRGESFWEVRAFQSAATSIEHATSMVKDLWDEGRLAELPGVGQGIAGYLDELFRLGSVRHFEEIKKGLPRGMFAFLAVPGIGAKTAYRLAKELGVQSLSELKKAAREGRVRHLEGFGVKREAEILAGIGETEQQRSRRMLLPQALGMAVPIKERLARVKGVARVEVLGSVRRRVATVGDIDLAVAVSDRIYAKEVLEAFVSLRGVQRVEEKGRREAAVTWSNGRRVDLRVQEKGSFGALLQHYTGSKAHNIHLRKIAQGRGYSLSEDGVKSSTKGPHPPFNKGLVKQFADEESLYKFLGLDWIPPELREDTGEIEAAQKGELPRLVRAADIRGDLHLHCAFDLQQSHDLGRSSMEQIAQKARELGYEYVVLGSHNPSVYNHSERQMVELVKHKQRAINKLQKKLGPNSVRLLNGVEVDILADGRLALPDSALKLLDVVVVSVHSGMRQSKEKLTERVINALKNPYTHILGHPTGRLLLQREGYEMDWERVFAVAKKYHKAIEINSFYNRLDLPDSLVRQAVGKGVRLVINTDAHAASQMDLMGLGVSVARRGWAEKRDILNTRPWAELRKFWQSSRFR